MNHRPDPALRRSNLKPKRHPQTGIWFFVRLPTHWEIRSFLDNPEKEIYVSHPESWPLLANDLSLQWAPLLGENPQTLRSTIEDACYGFPRGRISKDLTGTYCCFWGGEAIVDADVQARISQSFRQTGKYHPQWLLDEHEKCQIFDRDLVRDAFRLTENWEAI